MVPPLVPPTPLPSHPFLSISSSSHLYWNPFMASPTWPHGIQDPPYPVLTWEMQQVPVPWLGSWTHLRLDVGAASLPIHEQRWGSVPWSTSSPSFLLHLEAGQRLGRGDREDSSSLWPELYLLWKIHTHSVSNPPRLSQRYATSGVSFKVAHVMPRATRAS